MKKLIYLIVVIVVLGLIVAGCGVPVVPPTEQNEPGALPNKSKPGEVKNLTTKATYSTIQEAINAASSGDTISVGPGEYDEGSLVFNTDDITLFGSGADTTTIITSSSTYGISVPSGVDNITIKGFTIEENTAHDGDKVTSRFHLKISHNSGFTLEDVNLVGPGRDNSCITGLDLHTVQSVTIKNVEITGYSKNGVGVTAPTSVLLFEDVTIEDNGYTVSTGWAGISFYTMGGGDITNVQFLGTNTISNNPMGIYVENTGGDVSITGTNTTTLSGCSVGPLVTTKIGDLSIVDVYAKNVFNVPVRLENAFATFPNSMIVGYWHDVTSAGIAANNLLADGNPVIFNLTNGEWYVVAGINMNIQAAIDVADPAGTVNVVDGTYTEQVLINKSLSLVGQSEAGTILDGLTLDLSVGIEINADNVEVQNFTIKNYSSVGLIPQHYLSGVWPNYIFRQMENIKLQDVTVKDSHYGYYPTKVTNLIIDDCDSIDNTADGIFAIGCPGIQITNCNITNSGDHGMWVGIFTLWSVGPSDNALISNNRVDGAREGGISFVASDGAIISGNTITNVAGDGYSVGALNLKDSPSNVEAFNNTIYGNDGNWDGYNGTGHGIGIDGTPSNINLHHNNIYNNAGYGIYNYSNVPIVATCNWWGDFSGPSGEGIGDGDAVSENVDFSPWLLDLAPYGLCFGCKEIVECAKNVKNHGKFVSCVSDLTKDWLKDGLITAEDKAAITKWAAQSDIGKK